MFAASCEEGAWRAGAAGGGCGPGAAQSLWPPGSWFGLFLFSVVRWMLLSGVCLNADIARFREIPCQS